MSHLIMIITVEYWSSTNMVKLGDTLFEGVECGFCEYGDYDDCVFVIDINNSQAQGVKDALKRINEIRGNKGFDAHLVDLEDVRDRLKSITF